MDKSLGNLEADFEDMNCAIDSSSQHGVSLLGNSHSLNTPRDFELDEHIGDNEEDNYVPPEAKRLALDKAKSLSFDSSGHKGKEEDGKDNATDYLIPCHNHRLRGILEELSSQHRWKECAGVLSALLKGLVHDINFFRYRFKYWAAMETLRQIESNQGNEKIFIHLFELLWKKQPDPKHAINKKLRPSIQLEKVLYFISQGKLDDASLNSKEFLKEVQFRDDPVANMVYGLIVYQKWFDAISKKLNLKEHDMLSPREDMEMDSLETSSKNYQSVQNSHPNISGENSKENFFITLESDSSIGNGKEVPMLSGHHSSKRQCRRGPIHGTSKICMQAFNEGTDEDVSSHDLGGISGRITILSSPDLDRILFPIRLPATQEKTKYMIPMEADEAKVYHEALKHFEVALFSSLPLLTALVPYLQLLLANGQVKEAWKKIEKLCHDSNHLLLFSLRARLAESFTPKQPTLLVRCYEELLCRNPASGQSIKCLVKLHKKGSYQTESLLECIALHLDAAYGCAYIWRELASCFEEIQAEWQTEHESDRLSTEQVNYSDIKYGCSFSNQLPRMFLNSQLRSNWMLRCKWWAGRHFGKDRIHFEKKEAGNWELVTFKAACASHILGPTFGYVNDIYTALESIEEKNMLALLKRHIHCSLGLKKHLYNR